MTVTGNESESENETIIEADVRIHPPVTMITTDEVHHHPRAVTVGLTEEGHLLGRATTIDSIVGRFRGHGHGRRRQDTGHRRTVVGVTIARGRGHHRHRPRLEDTAVAHVHLHHLLLSILLHILILPDVDGRAHAHTVGQPHRPVRLHPHVGHAHGQVVLAGFDVDMELELLERLQQVQGRLRRRYMGTKDLRQRHLEDRERLARLIHRRDRVRQCQVAVAVLDRGIVRDHHLLVMTIPSLRKRWHHRHLVVLEDEMLSSCQRRRR